MSKRITIDLEYGYDQILSITAIGSRYAGEFRASTYGINTNNTTWLTVGEDGKVTEHGTQSPKEGDHIKTIEAEPVRHGRWEWSHGMNPPEYHHRKKCSLCDGWALQDPFGRELMSRYCPNCGAKMRCSDETK